MGSYDDYDDFSLNKVKPTGKKKSNPRKTNTKKELYNSKHIRVQEQKIANSTQKKPKNK